jgi:tRNA pseudouridine55 synthase
MSSLRRTKAGIFTIDMAYTLDEIVQAAHKGDVTDYIHPIDTVFSEYPAITIDDVSAQKFKNGAPYRIENTSDGTYRFYGTGGEFLLLGEMVNGTVRTIKSFFG